MEREDPMDIKTDVAKPMGSPRLAKLQSLNMREVNHVYCD